MSKSIGQIVYGEAGQDLFPWAGLDDCVKKAWTRDAKALLTHAAQLLREQGGRESTYALQDAFNRAAKIRLFGIDGGT